MDIETLDGRTDLPCVIEPSPQRALDGLVYVGIVHNDHRIGTPEFQREVLDMCRCKLPDSLSGSAVAGERDLFYPRIFYESLADIPAAAGNHVQDPRRKTGFVKDSCKAEIGKGGRGRRLQDQGISCKQCRPGLPAHDEDGHIPGDYSAADTKRFTHDKGIARNPQPYRFPGRLCGYTGIILENIGIPAHFVNCFAERFSLLGCQEMG